nr:MAG TPA: hypothetical protein [Caudoviricetes sp.]
MKLIKEEDKVICKFFFKKMYRTKEVKAWLD